MSPWADRARGSALLCAAVGRPVLLDIHRGGIPDRDIDGLDPYWQVLPAVRPLLIESAGRPGCSRLKPALRDVDALLTSLTRLIAKKRDLEQAGELLTGRTRLV